MSVIIMRGLPGSGKTTWIKQLVYPKIVCSADDYHMVDGVYRYDPKRAGWAHDQCLKKYLHLLQLKTEQTVIVDNTNTSLMEIAPYARLASVLEVPFRIVYVYTDFATAYARGTHQVPFSTLVRMNRALMEEDIPPYWPQEVVIAR